MTLTEKILARAAGKASVQAGDNVWVNADILMTHDVCGPGTIGVFKREFGEKRKVWDRNGWSSSRITTFSPRIRNPTATWTFCANSSREQELPYFYDVIDDPDGHWDLTRRRGMLQRQYGGQYAGVCHTALPQKGHTRPGEVLFGTDSHTCMAGAFNEFATGIGNTDAGFVMGTGKLLLKVPETMHFRLEGQLQPGVMAKDIILHCIGEIGFDGATYRAMQFDGPGVAGLSMDDRMTIANMAIEAGGKNGIFPFDARTAEFVDARTRLNGTRQSYEPVEADAQQKFVYERSGSPRWPGADGGVPSRSRPAQNREGARPYPARPRVRRLLHRRQDQRLSRVRARAPRAAASRSTPSACPRRRKSCTICNRRDGTGRRSGRSWSTPECR